MMGELWQRFERGGGWKYAIVLAVLVPPWALFCLYAYWYFVDTDLPAIHTSVEVRGIDGVPITRIKRGERLIIARESCVKDEGRAFYTRTLVSKDHNLIYFMPSGEQRLVKGCARRFNDVIIPSYVIPGFYDYVVSLEFENNPLIMTRMVLPIPSFEILP